GDGGRAFIDATLDVLLDWHEADPVDAFEIQRNERIYRAQGNRNPFVLDPTLLRRALYQGPNQPRPRDLWMNEIHHSNDGTDLHEGVEIAGRAGTDLYGYRVWVYSGYGFMYQVDGNGSDGTPAIAFRGTIDDEGGGLGAVWQGTERLRGGCQGLALTDPDGVLVQFLSYGGCQFNAIEGPVFDAAESTQAGAGAPSHPDSLAWSTVIRGARQANATYRRVQEWSEMPAGYSLQLSGAGDAYEDFTWTGPLPETRGRLGDYQAPSAVASRTSGWASGDAIPLGLLAPAVDTGHDEDRDDGGSRLEPIAHGGDAWTVSPPSPNPARTSTRLHIGTPPVSRVQVTVF
ncbi:MAG: endonuclease, partial [Bacteroidota bacterium]